MKLVYICSPYAGDIENNLRFARAACRYAVDQGCAPIAVHMLYPQILDDSVPAEREAGIQMGLRVLASCDEVWICGKRISHGMGCEIAEAERLGIPIQNISTEQIKGGIAMKQYGIWARRSAGSICGAAEAWLKNDGKPITFDTYEEAATEAERLMRDIRTPNVSYFPKEREIELEEAPTPGMKLQL
ncbi:hypothetical protein Desdi_1340 [Desulfitobacterium dichloroeliminans LMG P-21439]|uniref:DUF7768 domain-containing protein n=1 Tax=Desulfitobacterium dichloroeliminans (strain LMG P-21439 / DCA1) TaxID=871963 RepID=L0F745_DESDL|nr:DUF4406 domain-containing protein [Desulfitobacterium dichloroeliminans]AGA68850.1 hypothetical protein Desdi_1340 [Desulfitobacterium dichloroeliminans LMG P-21439]UWG96013.1 hypothetical protein LPY66_13985 [Dehalobacter sp. DCM]